MRNRADVFYDFVSRGFTCEDGVRATMVRRTSHVKPVRTTDASRLQR